MVAERGVSCGRGAKVAAEGWARVDDRAAGFAAAAAPTEGGGAAVHVGAPAGAKAGVRCGMRVISSDCRIRSYRSSYGRAGALGRLCRSAGRRERDGERHPGPVAGSKARTPCRSAGERKKTATSVAVFVVASGPVRPRRISRASGSGGCLRMPFHTRLRKSATPLPASMHLQRRTFRFRTRLNSVSSSSTIGQYTTGRRSLRSSAFQ